MDLVEIFEVIFGAGFIILALIGSRQIFGGIFYSKKVKAVVGKRESKVYANIDGVRYTESMISIWQRNGTGGATDRAAIERNKDTE